LFWPEKRELVKEGIAKFQWEIFVQKFISPVPWGTKLIA
jgi:hypothetical protein